MRAWIWFWFNDITRLVFLCGLHVPLLVLGCYAVFGPGVYLNQVAFWSYGVFFCWAMLDNDYTQLERIGLDVYRRPLARGASNIKADGGPTQL